MTYKPTDIADEGTIVLRSSNIKNGKIDLTDLVRVKTIIRENQFVEQNDIVICARNGSKALVGKCAIFNLAMSESVSFGAFMAILRTAFYDYVYYFLNTQLFRNILNSDDSKQINQLTQDMLKNTLIPFPPQNEQRKIVTALNEIMHQISSIDNNANAVEHTKEVLKSRILELAIQGKLVPQDENDEPANVLLERIRAERKAKLGKKYVESYIYKGDDNCYYEKVGSATKNINDEIPFDIPDSWRWARVDTLFQHNTGKALNSANTKGNYREYITTSNLYWNYFKLDSLKKMLFTDEEIDKCSLKKGDLLVCEGGDIGRAAIWNYDVPMCIQNHIHRLRAYSAVETKFYYCVLYLYKQLGIIGGKGIGIQGLSTKALGRIIFPVPPLAEQKRIVEQINVIFSKLKDEI